MGSSSHTLWDQQFTLALWTFVTVHFVYSEIKKDCSSSILVLILLTGSVAFPLDSFLLLKSFCPFYRTQGRYIFLLTLPACPLPLTKIKAALITYAWCSKTCFAMSSRIACTCQWGPLWFVLCSLSVCYMLLAWLILVEWKHSQASFPYSDLKMPESVCMHISYSRSSVILNPDLKQKLSWWHYRIFIHLCYHISFPKLFLKWLSWLNGLLQF
jgi:hypothetical protein